MGVGDFNGDSKMDFAFLAVRRQPLVASGFGRSRLGQFRGGLEPYRLLRIPLE